MALIFSLELSIKIIDKSRKVVPFSKEPLFFILLNVPCSVSVSQRKDLPMRLPNSLLFSFIFLKLKEMVFWNLFWIKNVTIVCYSKREESYFKIFPFELARRCEENITNSQSHSSFECCCFLWLALWAIQI